MSQFWLPTPLYSNGALMVPMDDWGSEIKGSWDWSSNNQSCHGGFANNFWRNLSSLPWRSLHGVSLQIFNRCQRQRWHLNKVPSVVIICISPCLTTAYNAFKFRNLDCQGDYTDADTVGFKNIRPLTYDIPKVDKKNITSHVWFEIRFQAGYTVDKRAMLPGPHVVEAPWKYVEFENVKCI